jgi:hypothetical protein
MVMLRILGRSDRGLAARSSVRSTIARRTIPISPNRNFDPTLNPQLLFFHGPASPADVANWDQAKQWFNFGTLEVGAEGDLTAEVIDTAGEPRFSLTLEP